MFFMSAYLSLCVGHVYMCVGTLTVWCSWRLKVNINIRDIFLNCFLPHYFKDVICLFICLLCGVHTTALLGTLRTTFRGRISPSTTWDPGITLRPMGFGSRHLTHWAILLAPPYGLNYLEHIFSRSLAFTIIKVKNVTKPSDTSRRDGTHTTPVIPTI